MMGELVIVREDGRIRRERAFIYRCFCGNEFRSAKWSVEKGTKKSCGCSKRLCRATDQIGRRTLWKRYRNNAKNRGIEFDIDIDKFVKLTSMNCAYCGVEPRQTTFKTKYSHLHYKYNGLDRVDSSLGYEESNIVPCCLTCNFAKSNSRPEEWNEWLERICKFNAHRFTEVVS